MLIVIELSGTIHNFQNIFSLFYVALHPGLDLIKKPFQKEGFPCLACNDRNAIFTLEHPKKSCMVLSKSM